MERTLFLLSQSISTRGLTFCDNTANARRHEATFETKSFNRTLKLSDYKCERGDRVEQGGKTGMQSWKKQPMKEKWSREVGTFPFKLTIVQTTWERVGEDKKNTIPQDDNNSEWRKHIHTKQIRFLLIVCNLKGHSLVLFSFGPLRSPRSY